MMGHFLNYVKFVHTRRNYVLKENMEKAKLASVRLQQDFVEW